MTIFLNFTYFPGKGKGGGVEDFWQMLEKSPMHTALQFLGKGHVHTFMIPKCAHESIHIHSTSPLSFTFKKYV